MGEENKAKTKKDGKVNRKASEFLVVEDTNKPDTWHLPVMTHGKLDSRLMGAAHAALTVGYRGNKYSGPNKDAALAKLKRLYKKSGMKWPEDKKGDDGKKNLSLIELENRVHVAIKEKIMEVNGIDDELDMPYCHTEIFVDFAIVKAPAGLYQVPYSFDAETYEVSLGDPVKVKIEYVLDNATDDDEGEVSVEEGKYEEMLHKSADLLVVKSLGNERVGGYAVLFGDESKKDLTGEWFAPDTEELTVIYDAMGKLPLLYHHSLDDVLKTSVIGVVDTLRADDKGLWYEAQRRKAGDYEEYVKKLIDDGKLKTSTQTFPVSRRVNEKTGKIERWPIVEITMTPTPAEHRMLPVAHLKSAYQEIGCSDLACVLKSKLGIEEESDDTQGAEKARMLAALRQERVELELLEI